MAAGSNWDDVRGTDRQLAESLGQQGTVLWVDPPISMRSARPGSQRLLGGRVLHQGGGIYRLSVVVPPGVTRPVVRSLVGRLMGRAVRRAVDRLELEPSVVISMGLNDCFGWLPGVQRLVYLTDDLPSGSAYLGMSRQHLERLEDRCLTQADTIACVSEVLADHVRERGFRLHLVPNGCDCDHFSSSDEVASVDRGLVDAPLAVLCGNLNQRIDWDLVEQVASGHVNLLIIGPVRTGVDESRFAVLCARPNVQWTGRVDYSSLPAYLAAADVGITPYVDNEFNRASFPLKTLEYLAAGLPVVSTDLPSVHWLGTDLIRTASDSTQFIQAIVESVDPGTATGSPASRRQFAEKHSWDSRATDLLSIVDAADGRPHRAARGNHDHYPE